MRRHRIKRRKSNVVNTSSVILHSLHVLINRTIHQVVDESGVALSLRLRGSGRLLELLVVDLDDLHEVVIEFLLRLRLLLLHL